jgi:flagellar biosynthesis protein FliR
MPQMNLMTAGLSIRVVVGMLVLILGIKITGDVLSSALTNHVDRIEAEYATPAG